MSEYCKITTEFKSEPALIAALQETGNWTRDQIEVHAEAQHLYGYHDDQRPEVANVIIRRQHVGSASNDIGFVRGTDGKLTAIISQYDSHKYGPQWQGRLKGNYAYHAVKLQQQARGRTVHRQVMADGRQVLTIGGIR